MSFVHVAGICGERERATEVDRNLRLTAKLTVWLADYANCLWCNNTARFFSNDGPARSFFRLSCALSARSYKISREQRVRWLSMLEFHREAKTASRATVAFLSREGGKLSGAFTAFAVWIWIAVALACCFHYARRNGKAYPKASDVIN
jgi:hypothetical protein